MTDGLKVINCLGCSSIAYTGIVTGGTEKE
jgi:hypothetical protein